MIRINIGCGQNPTEGWVNIDNSPAVLLARIPLVPSLLNRIGVLSDLQYENVQFAKAHPDIKYGDASRHIPYQDGTVEIIYSSHMLEHLDRGHADAFLDESKRLLCSGGIIRISVPDLEKQAVRYVEERDADEFIKSTDICREGPRGAPQKLASFFIKPRSHQWMYDGASLCRLLEGHGFVDARIIEAGKTWIPDPGALDLEERASESVFVEARNP